MPGVPSQGPGRVTQGERHGSRFPRASTFEHIEISHVFWGRWAFARRPSTFLPSNHLQPTRVSFCPPYRSSRNTRKRASVIGHGQLTRDGRRPCSAAAQARVASQGLGGEEGSVCSHFCLSFDRTDLFISQELEEMQRKYGAALNRNVFAS